MESRGKHAIEGLTRRLAEFAVSFRLENAPTDVLENAKLAILDCLGVSILATKHEIGDAVRRFAQATASPGPCVVWGTDIWTNARDAALMNGTLAHGLDFDDRNHSSTYSLAAPLAIAEEHQLSSNRVLEGFIVGREIRNSLDSMFHMRGSGIGPGARGWHSNGVLGPLAAAAATARTLELDEDCTLAALGLATASSGALTRDGGTMAKPFRTGHAASTGITCVLLAMSGFTSDATALEGRFGYFDALGPLPEEILVSVGKDIGKSFNLSKPIRAKRLASCSASHGGIEAMLALTRRERIDPEHVERIECNLKPYPLVRCVPQRGYEGRFSMPFCLAISLVHGDVKPDYFSDGMVMNPTIQYLIANTHHVNSEDLTVYLKDGRRLVEKMGTPTDFTTRTEIETKFAGCVSGILSNEAAKTVVEFIRDLDEAQPIPQLSTCLTARK